MENFSFYGNPVSIYSCNENGYHSNNRIIDDVEKINMRFTRLKLSAKKTHYYLFSKDSSKKAAFLTLEPKTASEKGNRAAKHMELFYFSGIHPSNNNAVPFLLRSICKKGKYIRKPKSYCIFSIRNRAGRGNYILHHTFRRN